jgi:SWI/SNF-related matrix-associated actin-dependent regulator of chromatin subfamily A-like protein 1
MKGPQFSPDRRKYDYSSDKSIHLKLEEFLPPHIFKHLLTYQSDSIKKGIKLYGRILINDDFGTGKSLQALGLALAYRTEWPLIILCPNFAKFSWRTEILKWLPGFEMRRI